MENNLIAVADVTNQTFEQREMSAEELASDEANRLEAAERAAKEAEELAIKTAVKAALLDKLGITEDEAKLLVG